MNAYIVSALLLASFVCAENVGQLGSDYSVYGYLTKIGVPLAEKIRQAEEKAISERIIGGSFAQAGQFPYQAGLISSIIGVTTGNGVCGGSLISANRVLTAAHCWFDGLNQAWKLEVVLGAPYLFFGGLRIETSDVAVHPQWTPSLIRNDIAIIRINSVTFSDTIRPIELPTGAELNEDFAGVTGVVSGYGLTVNGGSVDGNLRHVNVNVISNRVCSLAFPFVLQDSNICTSGAGGVGTCQGDSGGPLAVFRSGRYIEVGVVSFGNALAGGCDSFLPNAFVRVSSYIDFIRSHL